MGHMSQDPTEDTGHVQGFDGGEFKGKCIYRGVLCLFPMAVSQMFVASNNTDLLSGPGGGKSRMLLPSGGPTVQGSVP